MTILSSPEKEPAETPSREWQIGGVRLRVIVLLFVAQFLLITWIADSEIARNVYLIGYALMMPTVLYLLFVRLFSRWLPFDRKELMLVYIVLTATLPIMGFGAMRFLIPGMGFLSYFSETQPQWTKYLSALTHFPILHDPAAIQALYRGSSAVPWQAWTVPILFWSAYLLLLSGAWVGLAAILHRIWIRQERLTFPITLLPLQLTDPKDDLFRRKLHWLGFAVPVVFQSLLALHEWYPVVPALQLKAQNIGPQIFSGPPWNAIPEFQIGFYPMAFGLAYFVPSQISFSCWFFLLLSKFSFAAGAMAGLGSGGPGIAGRFPFREEQGSGAWIAFGLLALWGAYRQWGSLIRDTTPSEQRAINRLGIMGGVCVALCIGLMLAVGVTPLVAVGTVIVYVTFVLTAARTRAEAGSMFTMGPALWTPNRVMNSVNGTIGVSNQSLAAGGHFDLVHVDIRGQSLSYLLEGLKIADTLGIKWRTVLIWVAIGSVTALILGWWTSLSQFYELGAATAKSNAYALVKVQIAMREMNNLATNQVPTDYMGVGAMTLAGLFTVLLAFLQMRFLSFPFSAVGYVLSNTYTMNAFFVPFFMTWLIKLVVQRWGGSSLYRRSIPFFLGLILGDIVTQAFWTFIGRLIDAPVYQFLS